MNIGVTALKVFNLLELMAYFLLLLHAVEDNYKDFLDFENVNSGLWKYVVFIFIITFYDVYKKKKLQKENAESILCIWRRQSWKRNILEYMRKIVETLI